MLYLEQSDEHGDFIKQGLSPSSLEALKKTMDHIKDLHQKADENYQCLRHSEFFSEREVDEHEEWFDRVHQFSNILI